jgi:hypothetical protein
MVLKLLNENGSNAKYSYTTNPTTSTNIENDPKRQPTPEGPAGSIGAGDMGRPSVEYGSTPLVEYEIESCPYYSGFGGMIRKVQDCKEKARLGLRSPCRYNCPGKALKNKYRCLRCEGKNHDAFGYRLIG